MKNSVAIISGGTDSVTMLYDYSDDIGLALSFDYGAPINRMEIPFAQYHSKKLGICHKIINIDFIKENFNSNLLGDSGAPDVIPFRNGIMLSIACAFAENANYKYVMIANNADDHNAFPDCRAEFINSMSEGLKYGTSNKIEIAAPYTSLTKAQIIQKGVDIGIDYGMTYSCYSGDQFHCGKCNACRKRKMAFEKLIITDPTHYE